MGNGKTSNKQAISESMVTYTGQGVETVGVDIGYGASKALKDGASTAVVFPSVSGAARAIKFRAEEIAAKYPGDQLTDDDGSWFVGDLAQSQLSPEEQRSLTGRGASDETFGNAFRLRMMKVALGKLFPAQNGDVRHIRVVTGLPVDHMTDAANLHQLLLGRHFIHTDSTQFVANVVDVAIMPQPYGRIYAEMLLADGRQNPAFTHKVVGVADIGRFSIDLAVDNCGEYIDSMSGSSESGVHMAQGIIANMLEQKYRQKPTMKMIEEVLRSGETTVYGERENFKEAAAEAKQPVVDAALELMTSKWRTGMTLDRIYVTGGGGPLVITAIKKAFRQAEIGQYPQTDNARGYLYYGMWLARQ